MHRLKPVLRGAVVVCLVLSALAWAGAAAAIDCKDATIKCWGPAQDQGGQMVVCGTVRTPTHYIAAEMVCKPKVADFCTVKGQCNDAYPSCCKGNCKVYWKGWQGSWRACPGSFRPPY